MYDDEQFFIENDFGRYSIGSTTDGLKPSDGGSLAILIEREAVGYLELAARSDREFQRHDASLRIRAARFSTARTGFRR